MCNSIRLLSAEGFCYLTQLVICNIFQKIRRSNASDQVKVTWLWWVHKCPFVRPYSLCSSYKDVHACLTQLRLVLVFPRGLGSSCQCALPVDRSRGVLQLRMLQLPSGLVAAMSSLRSLNVWICPSQRIICCWTWDIVFQEAVMFCKYIWATHVSSS